MHVCLARGACLLTTVSGRVEVCHGDPDDTSVAVPQVLAASTASQVREVRKARLGSDFDKFERTPILPKDDNDPCLL